MTADKSQVSVEGATSDDPDDLEDGELISLAALSFEDLEELLPKRVSLSLSNMGEGKWAAILRPVPTDPPKIITRSYVAPSKTPIMAAGPTLGAVVSAVFAAMAPEGLRCPQCGEFSMEKLGQVAGSDTWVECLTCGKKYAAKN